MNINEQMNQLGQIGSVGYAPSDATVEQLLGRTRRARAVRQGSAALVGSVSAVGLGVVGAQAFVALTNQDDPAFRDRNLIENDLPSYFDFNEKFGEGYTGSDKATDDFWDKFYEELNIAAKIEAEHLKEQGSTEQPKTEEPKAPSCETVEYEYKYKSPATGCEWKIKDGWVKDPWTDTYVECVGSVAANHSPVGYYNCDLGRWNLATGYFQFGNGEIYKCENWTDAATGTVFQAAISNNPVSGSFNGEWAYKVIDCSTTKTYTSTVNDYRYYGNALTSWSGNVCTGKTGNPWSAPHRVSCLSYNALKTLYGAWSGDNGGNHPWTQKNGDLWVLQNANYKWLGECGRYYDSTNPGSWPEGWTWNGSSWTYTAPTPDPDPSTPTA